MNRRAATIFMLILMLAIPLYAVDIPYAVRYTDRVVFQGQWNNISGKWQIAGVEVTSSAAELNILDGCTATAAQLNALGGGTAVIGLAQITNALATGTYPIGTSASVPAAVINSGNIAIAQITNALATGTYPIGTSASVPAAVINSGNIAIARITNALATGTYSARGSVTSGTTSSETISELCNTVLTVGYSGLKINAAGLTTNKLLYTFPEGRIGVQGVVVRMVLTNTTNFNASANDVYSWSLGGAGNGDATADAGEVTFLAAQTLDTVDGSVIAFTNKAAIAAPFQVDGTTTPAPLWFHIFLPDASDPATKTNYFGCTGTVTITWSNLGDY
jgi:hypothetical protein